MIFEFVFPFSKPDSRQQGPRYKFWLRGPAANHSIAFLRISGIVNRGGLLAPVVCIFKRYDLIGYKDNEIKCEKREPTPFRARSLQTHEESVTHVLKTLKLSCLTQSPLHC